MADTFYLIVTNLSPDQIGCALTGLNFFDILSITLAISAVVASGGAALVVNILGSAIDVFNLVVSIQQCFFP